MLLLDKKCLQIINQKQNGTIFMLKIQKITSQKRRKKAESA